MKYGCRAHDYGCHSPEGLAEILQNNGYNAAQLALPKAICGIRSVDDVSPHMQEAVRTAFERHHIEITILSCYRDLSNPDDHVRRAAVNDVCQTLAYQNALGACAVGSESSFGVLTEEQKDATFPLLTDSVLRIVEKAAAVDGVFALEPVFVHTVGTLEKVRTLLEQVADPLHFKIIFDPVNVLTIRDVSNQDRFWPAWCEVIGDHLAAVHVKDVIFQPKGKQLPAALGKGQMDYAPLCSWLHQRHPDVALLRDEVILSCAQADLAYMRQM